MRMSCDDVGRISNELFVAYSRTFFQVTHVKLTETNRNYRSILSTYKLIGKQRTVY